MSEGEEMEMETLGPDTEAPDSEGEMAADPDVDDAAGDVYEAFKANDKKAFVAALSLLIRMAR